MADEEKLRDYLKTVTANLRTTRKQLRELSERRYEPIAIVGIGCRYPGGITGPDELWELVAGGRDAISAFPVDRGWDADRLDDPGLPSPATRQGGFLYGAPDFDADFFGISPREALAMDPQQRLLLETAWEALERAGIDPAALRGSRTGVFAGLYSSSAGYATGAHMDFEEATGHLLTGTANSVLSGRISFSLGLEGPSLSVDTACSSSLVALHLAAQALRAEECSLALAGGVTVMSTPVLFQEFSRQQGLAADGRCKPFSDAADGTGWGEGAGMLVLERLSDARRNGHRVLAVISGSAVNQDGASNGLTAPNGPSQRRVIEAALAHARLAPADVDAVEAHGTGTTLGDPIEAQALLAAYGQDRPGDRPLWLGSVKSNIGHTQAAAGVAGVIKMVMALRHGTLPRTLHAEQPSARVDWTAGNVRLLQEPVQWPGGERPRRAAVSAFGISGTNVHMVVEEAPAPEADPGQPDAQPAPQAVAPVLPGAPAWLFSARSTTALAAQAQRLRAHVLARPEQAPADVAWSLATTRSAFEHRAVVVGPEPLDGLTALVDGLPAPGLVTGGTRPGGVGRTVFVFPGQGSQWVGMGRELAEVSPVFAARLAECGRALAPFVEWELDDVLAGRHGFEAADVVQPALWAVMVSLAAVWQAAGVVPDAVVGHSQGEIAAAAVAGSLSLEDAAKVVALRSRTLTALAGRGGMLAVEQDAVTVREWIAPFGERLSVAAVNGPRSTVLSGEPEALRELARSCPESVRTRILPVDYASHSAHVDELREEILAVLGGITPQAAQLPMISAMSGELLAGPELDAAYWYASLRETVEFDRAIRTLGEQGHGVFVEASPHPVLTMAIGDSLADQDPVTVGTLRRDDGGPHRLLESFAEAHTQGVPLDWTAVLGRGRTVDLPTYAFQRRRYWPRRAEPVATVPASSDETWRYRIAWEPLTAPTAALTGTWLIVTGTADPGDCVRALAAHGAGTVVLHTDSADRRTLAAALAAAPAGDGAPAGVLSLLALDEGRLSGAGAGAVPRPVAATMALVQALGDTGIDTPLWAVTRGAVSTGPGDPPADPVQAQVWGLGRVAGLEHPDRWGGLVDLPAEFDAQTAARLAAVLADGAEDQVALRVTGLLGRRLERAPRRPAAPTDTSPWSPRGTVLVTGGTGSIGLHLSPWLAGRGARRLVLPTRSGPTPALAAHAADLAAAGTAVDVVACDIAERSALAGLLTRIDATGPALSTVIHAANVFHLTRIDDTDLDGLATALAAKAEGADHLDELAGDIDDFVLFSSIAAAWGSNEHGVYAAANAHLDALAEQRRARGRSALSLGWGIWNTRDWDAVDAAASHAPGTVTPSSLRAGGTRFLQAGPALDAMGRILDEGDAVGAYLAVADMDWSRFAPVFSAARSRTLLERIPEARQTPDEAAPAPQSGGGPAGELVRSLAAAAPAERDRIAAELVRSHAAATLGHRGAEDVPATRAFRDLGFDSLTAVELSKRLAAATGLKLRSSIVFDHPTPAALGGYLAATLLGTDTAAPAAALPVAAADPGEPIAIVGIGCRFPGGVVTPDQYWDLLASGADVIAGFPAERGWDPDLYDPDPDHPGKSLTRSGGFLYDAADFDAGFFGINPREAVAIDPQQRLLLETGWEALERAGIDPETLRGSATGVFAGAALTGYGAGRDEDDGAAEGYLVTGSASSIISGRVAYTLGLEGPAVTIDTACSSSLVALNLAGQALRSGECQLALVGGVMVMATPSQFVGFSRQRGLSPDGRCKAFGATADGMGLAEGAATIVVERLSDAVRNGHPVLAVVRGTAVNQDGASNGLTAPNGLSQQRVIRAALAAAGLAPAEVDAVEAHGTGTTLGDPVEAHALLATYGRERPEGRPLWLGSAKSNIGHTQTAAGLAGLIKMVLAMRHGVLPRTLHAEEPSPHIEWDTGEVRLLTRERPWTTVDGAPRRAGVSAFGMSGTNVHVILEESPAPQAGESAAAQDDVPLLSAAAQVTAWPVSARSPEVLAAQAGRLREFALTDDAPAATDVAWSLAATRTRFEHRAVVLGADRAELTGALAAVMTGRPAHNAVTGAARDGRTVFVFPGQGSQWVGMGRELLEESPLFAERFAACVEALAPYVAFDPRAVLWGTEGAPGLESADVMQPVLWAVMVSLAEVWQAAGVVPDAVVGHSQGEIAAAAVAGILSLEDAARVVALRSRALTGLGAEGGMLSVVMPADEVRVLLEPWGERLSVAAVNGPAATVVSGEPAALVEFERALRKRKVMRWRVPATDFVAHSVLCEPLATTLPGQLAGIRPRPGAVPFFSTVLGDWLDGAQLGPDYWYANVRSTVRFADAVVALSAAGHRNFIEVSAHPVLTAAVLETAEGADLPAPLAIGTLERDQGGARRLLTALAGAHVSGLPVDWTAVLPQGGPVELPTYAFQRTRYWLEQATAPAVPAPAAAPAPDAEAAVHSWRFVIDWAWGAEPSPAALTGRWLVLTPAGHPVHPCVRALADRGAETVVLDVDTAAPDRTALAARIGAAGERGAEPAGVLSLLALDTAPLPGHPAVAAGIAATLAAVQALGDTRTDAPLWVLTRGAVATGPDEPPAVPEQAQTWALGRTMAAEHPGRWGGLVDLPEHFDARAAARLTAVLAAHDENEIALRPAGIRLRRLAHAPKPAADRPRFTTRGTVLITGGTGHIGGHAARWTTGRGARRLVLTSRSGPAAEGVAQLAAELAAAGTPVDVVACDTARRPALAALLDRIAATGPQLSAVVHAAGALDDGVLDRLDPARLENTLAGKAAGAAALDELTAHLDLDAFVLCSSISATFGSGGQGNYAAANAYLDALAEQRRARGRTATSLAWGPWAGGGVGQASEGARQRLARNKWEILMEPQDAVRAMAQAIEDARHPALSLMAVDFAAMATARGPEQLRRAPLMRDLPEIRAAARDLATAAVAAAQDSEQDLTRRLSGLARTEQERTLDELIRTEAATVMGYASADAVEPGRAFSEIGLDSLTSVELRNRLATLTGLKLPTTLLFDHPDPVALAAHLCTQLTGADQTAAARPAAPGRAADGEPLAIVAMGCRLPGGIHSPDELWRLLADGGDAVSGLPTDRGWDLAALYDPDPDRPGTLYVRGGGFLHEAPDFDAGFFGISPREAQAMDPQQRLLLETCWEALEQGGIDPTTLRGTRTGVFVGGFGSGYDRLEDGVGTAADNGLESQLMIGNATSVLSGRVSYLLGLEGPALTVDTACSSSLVALHTACEALRGAECELALVGGVTVMPTPRDLIGFSRQRGLAADGRCKPFGAGADGMGMAEGVGVLAVERLGDARRNGHRILAVVRGSAVNQDGASNGLTAPNGPSQQRVIRAALAAAGLTTSDVDAVEAHGTGTELGDPIEAQALLATYGQDRPGDRPLWLGSVKSNIGHTQAAAGVAGVIKTILAMQHGLLPRTLHADRPSPHIDWSAGQVRLLQEPVAWPKGDRPRRTGISGFGVSGTNAHVIIEEAPAAERPPGAATTQAEPPAPAVLDSGAVAWPVAGRSATALAAQAGRLREHVLARPELDPADVAWSLATTRSAFGHRAVVLGEAREELAAGLAAVATDQPADTTVTGSVPASGPGRTVFVFPGQGSQWVGMGRELAEVSPVFAARLAACGRALAPHVEWELDDVLAGRHGFEAADVVQPALWAVMVSLAAVWQAAGVVPDAVVGHSQGEIAAAAVAGILSLEDAAKVVALRSRTLKALAGRGGMLSVAESADGVRERIASFGERLAIAAVNGPGATVVSGEPGALRELAESCPQTVRTRLIPVDYASHSAHVDDLREDILAVLGGITPQAAQVPMISAMSGEMLAGPELDAAYWYASLRRTVEFDRAVRTLGELGHRIFVEVSPHPVLAGPIGDALAERNPAVCGTLRRDDGGAGRLLAALAAAHVSGAAVDWTAVLRPAATVPLPTYAFQHRRYWPEGAAATAAAGHTGADAAFWTAVESGDARSLAELLDLDAGTDDASVGGLLPALAALSEYRRRERDGSALADLRYRITFSRVADPASPAGLTGKWLLVGAAADPDTAHLVAGALTGHGAEVVVEDGVDRAALARHTGLAGVVSLLALDESPDDPAAGHPAMSRGLAGTLGLIQSLGTAGIDAPLWVLTQGAVATGPGEAGSPPQAQVWGLGRVAGLEHPDRWGGLVDLPPVWDGRTATRLAALLAGTGEDQLALRPQGILARRLVRAGRPRTAAGGWSPSGTVLVTGGTGAIGSAVGRWLAGRGADRVLLASGLPLTDDTAALAALAADVAAAGSSVTVAACDSARRAELDGLLGRIAEEGPVLRGVVHAAGIGQATPLADTTTEELATVAGARAAGAQWLDELTAGLDLDAFVLFSSVAATWGSALVPGYAAGNAYVDALAERRRARGQVVTSVAWGPWDDGARGQSVRHGLRVLDPQVALRALGQAMDGGDTLVTVADVDWRSFAPAFTLYRPSPLLADLPEAAAEDQAPAAGGDGDEPGTDLARRLAELPPARRATALVDLVRTEAARVLDHTGADDIEPERAFRDLGFDSLTAIELRNRLAAATGTALPSTVVFEHPTALALAGHLLHTLAGPAADGDAATGPAPVLAELDRLEAMLIELTTRQDGSGAGAGADEDAARITARLDAVAATWQRLREGTGDGPGVAEQLEAAGDDEVFDFIGKEFGIQ